MKKIKSMIFITNLINHLEKMNKLICYKIKLITILILNVMPFLRNTNLN